VVVFTCHLPLYILRSFIHPSCKHFRISDRIDSYLITLQYHPIRGNSYGMLVPWIATSLHSGGLRTRYTQRRRICSTRRTLVEARLSLACLIA
jgi:hypothetical protein